MLDGPYDVSLVEGSVTTAEEVERIQEVRRQSKFLVTIGACATAGGIQSLRNWQNVDDFIDIVYARPDFIDTLRTSMPIAEYVRVDFELRGCPINKPSATGAGYIAADRPAAAYAALQRLC